MSVHICLDCIPVGFIGPAGAAATAGDAPIDATAGDAPLDDPLINPTVGGKSSILILPFNPSLTAYPFEMIATAKSAERVANFI